MPISTLNLNIPNFKCDGDEEHTLDNFYKIVKVRNDRNRPQYHQ